jgi:hypothetical protein
MNQALTFITDGGDTVRELPLYLSPESEHLLDWFHVTMRLTVLGQYAKGMVWGPPDHAEWDDADGGPDLACATDDLVAQLDRIKWFLWHGVTGRSSGNSVAPDLGWSPVTRRCRVP